MYLTGLAKLCPEKNSADRFNDLEAFSSYQCVWAERSEKIPLPIVSQILGRGQGDIKDVESLLYQVKRAHQIQVNRCMLDIMAIVSGGRKRSLSGTFAIDKAEARLPPYLDGMIVDSNRVLQAVIGWKKFQNIEPALIYRNAVEPSSRLPCGVIQRSRSLGALDTVNRTLLFPEGEGYTNMPPQQARNKGKNSPKASQAGNNMYHIGNREYEYWGDYSLVLHTQILDREGRPTHTKLVIDGHQAKHCDAMNFHSHYQGKSGSKFIGFTANDFIQFIDQLYHLESIIWLEECNQKKEGLSLRHLLFPTWDVPTAHKKRVAFFDANDWKDLQKDSRLHQNQDPAFSEGALKFFKVLGSLHHPISIGMHSSFTPAINGYSPFWAIHIFPEVPIELDIQKKWNQVKLCRI